MIGPKVFTLSSAKLKRKLNVSKYIWRLFSLAYLAPALEDSANLMSETRFYFELQYSVKKLTKLTLAKNFIKITASPSFT